MSSKLMNVINTDVDSFDNTNSPEYDESILDNINGGMDREDDEESDDSVNVDDSDFEDDEKEEEVETPKEETNDDKYEDMDDANDSKYDEMAKQVDAESYSLKGYIAYRIGDNDDKTTTLATKLYGSGKDIRVVKSNFSKSQLRNLESDLSAVYTKHNAFINANMKKIVSDRNYEEYTDENNVNDDTIGLYKRITNDSIFFHTTSLWSHSLADTLHSNLLNGILPIIKKYVDFDVLLDVYTDGDTVIYLAKKDGRVSDVAFYISHDNDSFMLRIPTWDVADDIKHHLGIHSSFDTESRKYKPTRSMGYDLESDESPSADVLEEPEVDETPEEEDLSNYTDESDKIPVYDNEHNIEVGDNFDGTVDEPLIASIKDADIGKPTTPEDALTNLVSYPTESADLESFAYISGVVGLGYKKITDTFTNISNMFTVADKNLDYNEVAKGFIFTNKDKKFKDYYSYLVGVPVGLTGYLKDISNYVKQDAKELDHLIEELDNGFTLISRFINSQDERESFVADTSYVKHINETSNRLLEKNKTFITKSKSDSRTIGSLLRNADDVKLIVSDLKEASKIIRLDKLETVKRKINSLDNLIVTMVDNKSKFSAIKIKEVSNIIDSLINFTNGVATMVYLKNTVDIVITDIKKLL